MSTPSTSSSSRSGCSANSPAPAPTAPTAPYLTTTTAAPPGPTLYFGKGFGDLPIGAARPLSLTGELTYTIADKKLKVDSFGNPLNNGSPNTWSGGLSLQYSIRYLSSQVKDYGLPTFVNRLTPVVELAWSSPASQPSNGRRRSISGDLA